MESKRQSNKRYDKYKRNQESRRFYKSKEWRKLRHWVLHIRDKGLCQRCLKNKRIVKADVVHHIKELIDYPELAFEESNLISWCHSCHNRHHKQGYSKPIEKPDEIDAVAFKANEELV